MRMRKASKWRDLWALGALLAALTLVAGCGEDEGSGDKDAGAATNDDTAGGGDAAPLEDVPTKTGSVKVLVFSKTAGFRHGSIEAAVKALEGVAADHDWDLIKSEDSKALHADALKDVDAVVFLMTTGDITDADAKKGLEGFVKGGGGWVGVHSASDTEYKWAWYGGLVGAYFKDHTAADAPGDLVVADQTHPATKHLPTVWQRKEEWYAFKSNPRAKAHVLMTLDKGAMGHDHPHAWCHRYEGGRAFYTAGGHSDAAWGDKAFLDHVAGAIDWAANRVKGDCSATVAGNYKLEEITQDVGAHPMELDVAPDGKVYYIHRRGIMKVWDPATKKTSVVADFAKDGGLDAPEDLPANAEDGLMGFALDPKFGDNGHVWIYHSIKSPVENHLSRYTVKDGKLDFKSEVVTLKVPVQRELCCHSAGNVQFGKDGLLYLSTGDNTNPFQSQGFSPIDEGKGREKFDAQGTSANTHDLRGKILRLKPKADGTYEVPAGNLFPKDGKGGKPEIYIMGVRNPFRMSPDSKTSRLFWAETGPDAGGDDPKRGPMGYDEVNVADKAGNFGWPLCIADNKPYVSYNFQTKASGAAYDCAKPVNDSPNNTGDKDLPAAQPAMIWYPYGPSPEFGAIPKGSGRTAMSGVLYRPTGKGGDLASYLDGKLIWMDWQRSWIYETTVDDKGRAVKLNRFVPELKIQRPIDMQVGPDGALYILEWGEKYPGNNPDARISKLTYVPTK